MLFYSCTQNVIHICMFPGVPYLYLLPSTLPQTHTHSTAEPTVLLGSLQDSSNIWKPNPQFSSLKPYIDVKFALVIIQAKLCSYTGNLFSHEHISIIPWSFLNIKSLYKVEERKREKWCNECFYLIISIVTSKNLKNCLHMKIYFQHRM